MQIGGDIGDDVRPQGVAVVHRVSRGHLMIDEVGERRGPADLRR
jgi:hypothetical protein